MAKQLKFTIISGSNNNVTVQYHHEFFSFIGISPAGGLTRISLYPYTLDSLVADVRSYSKEAGKEITLSPAEKILLQMVDQLRGEKNAEKRASLKHKFDALYSFAIPEQSTSEIAFEEGKKEASAWIRHIGHNNIAEDYSTLKDAGSVDQYGNIHTIFSRESEKYYPKAANDSFSWRQREAMNFLLNRLNTQMEAVAKGEEPVYDLHHNFNADLVREAKTVPTWIEKEKSRRAKFKFLLGELDLY